MFHKLIGIDSTSFIELKNFDKELEIWFILADLALFSLNSKLPVFPLDFAPS